MKSNILKQGSAAATAIISAIFTVVPEEVFKSGFVDCNWSDTAIIVTNRVIVGIVVLALSIIGCYIYRCIRCSVKIDNKIFSIKVEYKNLFSKRKKITCFILEAHLCGYR